MLPRKLTFVDVETTGGSFRKDRIIEIGIIQTEDGEVVNQFNSLIHPQQHVPQSILDLTGISAYELERAPSFREVQQEVGELLEDSVFVAHNAAFDYGFIKNEFKLLDHNYSAKCLCTVKLSRALFPKYRHHNLDSLIERFNFECASRHRALDDAKVMVDFVDLIKVKFPAEKIEAAVNRILKKPSTPIGVSQQLLDALPESPGVYIFYGDTDIPLYIGKSVNIKNRVLSHFSAASLSSTELKIASQVKRVETVTTEGELGALLRESKLIKQMQPVYNRRLRGATKLVYLGYKLNDAGYKEAVTFTSPPQEVLGIFKSLKQAKETLMELSEKHNLCKKLLNLEKPTSSCFGYQLEKCKGACVGKETPVMHNLRFDMAFVQTKLKSWPFDGAVMISEGNSKFLVDNWQYCELQEDNVDLVMEVVTGDVFDLDTYKILSSYIYSAKKQKNIVVLKK